LTCPTEIRFTQQSAKTEIAPLNLTELPETDVSTSVT